MKKLLTLLLLASLTACSAFSFADPKNFRFEDHKTQQDFQSYVNKQFPPGSSYQMLRVTMMSANATETENPIGSHYFSYSQKPGISTVCLTDWRLSVTTEGDTIQTTVPKVQRTCL